MILITGGAFQGKKEFARSLIEDACIVEGNLLRRENIERADIITDLHLYIRRILEEEKNAQEEVRKLFASRRDVIVTVAELGCGIVPMDAFDRNYRETVGRISCELAKDAEAVYRVSCGIGIRIK